MAMPDVAEIPEDVEILHVVHRVVWSPQTVRIVVAMRASNVPLHLSERFFSWACRVPGRAP